MKPLSLAPCRARPDVDLLNASMPAVVSTPARVWTWPPDHLRSVRHRVEKFGSGQATAVYEQICDQYGSPISVLVCAHSDQNFRVGVSISKKLAAFIVFGLALCAAFLFVSKKGLSEIERSVRQSVRDELAQSYGVSAVVEGEAGMKLFPRLALSFSDVAIRVPGGKTRSLKVERVEIPMRIRSLWRRSLFIEDVVLVRPVIEVRSGDVPLTAEQDGTSSIPLDPRKPERKPGRGSDFIKVSVSLGRVQIADGAYRSRGAFPEVSEVNGTLAMAPNSASIAFEGTLSLNGDQTAVSLHLEQPNNFAKGVETRLRVSTSSESSRVRFDGKGSLRPGLSLDGAFEGSSLHPQQVLDMFTGRPPNNRTRVPPITFKTHLIVAP